MHNRLHHCDSHARECHPGELLDLCVAELRRRSMELLCEIDRFAAGGASTSELRVLHELASGLEVVEAQLDYYFYDGFRELDPGEWASLLALLNAEAAWLEDQLLEIGHQPGAEVLGGRLRELSRCYADAVPQLIAARFANGLRTGAGPGGAAQRRGSPAAAPAPRCRVSPENRCLTQTP